MNEKVKQEMIDIKNNWIVNRPVDMIDRKLNVLEVKILRILLTIASKDRKQKLIIKAKNIANLLGYTKNYQVIDKAIKKLKQQNIEIRKSDDRWAIMSLLDYVEYNNGEFEIIFGTKFMELFDVLFKKYIKYNLKNALVLKSKYSIKLYEYLVNELRMSLKYNKDNIFEIDIEKLKELVGSNYNFRDFRNRILNPSVNAINKLTDINVKYELIKDGRKVVKIKFYCKYDMLPYLNNKKAFIGHLRANNEGKMIFTFTDSDTGKKVDVIMKDGLLVDVDSYKPIKKEKADKIYDLLYKKEIDLFLL